MKKKFLVFLLAFCFMLPIPALSACGDETQQDQQQQDDQIITFDDIIITSKQNINIYNGAQIEFDPNMQIRLQDFSIVSSQTQQDITSQTQFSLVKIGPNNQETPATTYEIGEYKAIFTYQTTTKSINFSIIPAVLNEQNVTTTLEESYDFEEGGVFPTASFRFGNTLLVKDVDYLLQYGENNQVGENAGTVVICPCGNYQASSELVFFFNINPLVPDRVMFENGKILTFNGEDQQNAVKPDISNLKGISNIQYYFYNQEGVGVAELRDAGNYRILAQIQTEDNYATIQNQEFYVTINKKSITDQTQGTMQQLNSITKTFRTSAFTADDFFTEVQSYLGHSQFRIEMAQDSETVDNTNASTNTKTGKFVIVGIDNYSGELEISYTIEKQSINTNLSNIFVNMNDSSFYYYTGSANTIRSVHCLVADNYVELVAGTDYSINYTTSNITAGTCNFTISGLGNYAGAYNGSFTINKKSITLEDPTWQGTTLTYNGTNQAESVGITNLPAYVNGVYTVYSTYNEYTNEFVNGTLLNAGTYTVVATFELKTTLDEFENAYATNYEITQQSFKTEVTINKVTAVANFDNNENSFVYTGSAIKPTNIIVEATVNNQNVVLTKDVDYALSYEQNPVNAYDEQGGNVPAYYSVTITDLSGNFQFQQGPYPSESMSLTYFITQKELNFNGNATITYPQVCKNVWNYLPYLNTTNAKIIDTDLDVEIPCSFSLANESTEIAINLPYYGNYALPENFENKTINENEIVVQNPYFDSFSLNGTQLTPEQIANLSSINWGDNLTFTLNSGYTYEYIIAASGSETRIQNETIFNRNLGVEKVVNTDDYYFESRVIFHIYQNGNPSNYVAAKEFTINRGTMFDSLKVAGTTIVSESDKFNYIQNYRDEIQVDTNSSIKTIYADLLPAFVGNFTVTIVESKDNIENNVTYDPDTKYAVDFDNVDFVTLIIVNNGSSCEVVNIRVVPIL